MSRTGTALICIVLMYLNGPAFGDALWLDPGHDFSAKVVAVLDGDTVLVVRKGGGESDSPPPVSSPNGRRTGKLVKIRLSGIDAPEKDQAYGAASRRSLAEMVLHKQIQVHTVAIDKYERSVAQLEVNGLMVNEEMVRRGMAWEYSHFHSDRRYISLEKEARQAGRGLWAQRDPIPPWQWRKQHAAETGMPVAPAPDDFTCGSKHLCSEMSSCDEAHYYLTVCGVKALNPKGDGMPCENLCKGTR